MTKKAIAGKLIVTLLKENQGDEADKQNHKRYEDRICFQRVARYKTVCLH
jgi:hypothetical protein